MASNQTSNYGLNQWEATDQVLRTDFNADNAKIDAALKGLVDQNTALEGMAAAAAAAAGNCEMELITYTGTGTNGDDRPTLINFTQLPDIFIIGGEKALMVGQGGAEEAISTGVDVEFQTVFFMNRTVEWNGNQLQLNDYYARFKMNTKNAAYWVVGLRRRA